jgi:hypothetical protein
MKNTFILMTGLLLILLLSCKKEDLSLQELIIGEWQLVDENGNTSIVTWEGSHSYYVGDCDIEYLDIDVVYKSQSLLRFFENGRYEMDRTQIKNGIDWDLLYEECIVEYTDHISTEEVIGEYEFENNDTGLEFFNFNDPTVDPYIDEDFIIIKIDENDLILKSDFGNKEIVRYKRVK